jgi:hypothetical protein
MSAERGDCEHGHAAEVAELASLIAADHGIGMKSCVLVIVGEDGTTPTVLGRFNTTALSIAADAVLAECAKHEPDGCAMCDPAAGAARVALDVLRNEFHRQQRVHQRSRKG